MAPPTWKLVLTTEEGSQFSSRQFKSNLCPCQCCWCGKCDFKRLPDDALVAMLPRLFPSDDTKQPFWSLVLIFTDESEFPSRPLKPVHGLCRYCWCQQRGSKQIQESDITAFESFYSQEAAGSLKQLLDSSKTQAAGGTSDFILTRRKSQEDSGTFANDYTADSSYEPVLLRQLLLQKSGKNPSGGTIDSEDELFQSASEEDQMSSNAEDEDPTWRASSDSDDQLQETSTKQKSSKRPKQILTSKRPHQCDVCPATFTRTNHLRVHKRIHSEEKSIHSRDRPNKCTECPSTFNNPVQFENHKRVHSRNNTQNTDKQQRGNQKDEVTKSIKKKRICLKCNKSFEDKQALIWHTKKEHNQSRLLQCGLCPSRFKNEDQRIIHQRSHKNSHGKYSCKKCEYSSVYAKSVMKHMLSHSRNNDVEINTDQSKSKIPRNLKPGTSGKSAPSATSTGFSNISASISTRNDAQQNPGIVTMGAVAVYESDPNNQRINEFAGDSTWTGAETGEEGHSSEASEEYEDVKEAPIQRAKRNRALPKKSKLSKPSRNQVAFSKQPLPSKKHEPKNHWCIECYKSFERKESLDEHLKEHNPTHPFKCYLCSDRFSSRKERISHQGSHRNTIGRYECSQCEYSTVNADAMYKHKRTHTGEKPFQCNECAYSFALLENLNKHKLQVHRQGT